MIEKTSHKIDMSTELLKQIAMTTKVKLGTNNKNHRGKRHGTVQITPKFQGHYEALKGHVYDVTHQQADHFVKTTQAVADHFASIHTHAGDMRNAILNQELPTYPAIP
jgi:hypothetical protein